MTEPKSPAARHPPFVVNVLWSWLGVGVNVLLGLFLSRYIIRTLGEERYGLWVLVFATVDYLWFFDLGFNTAITNFSARFRALEEASKINELINTALVYFLGVSLLLLALVALLSHKVARVFPRVSLAYRGEFSMLLLITGASWSFFVLLHIFTSCLDGFQRFDLTTRSWVTTMLLRSGGCVAVLACGYGLVEMGIVAAGAQLAGYMMNVASFRRIFPELRFSTGAVRRSMLQEMARYGAASLMASVSSLMLNQSAPVLIGRYRSAAEVGYFALPLRVLQYAADAVSRVGLITRSSVAERDASGNTESVVWLGIYLNRYCFTLFVPLSLFLLVYGREFIRLWITPSYAEWSAPLLPILTPAMALAMAGQFNSSAILFGLGQHRRYASGLAAEASAAVAGLLLVIPRYGIRGAAIVVAVLMLAVRGLYTPWLVCQSLQTSFAAYMRAVYLGPLAAAIPLYVAARFWKRLWIPGDGWLELILAAVLLTAAWLPLAWFAAVDAKHRGLLLAWIGKKWCGIRKS